MSARAGESGERFEGFVVGGATVTLPAQLFVELLPAIEDEAELRVTLYVLYAIRRKGSRNMVRRSALTAERPLQHGVEGCGGAEALAPALVAAVARGTLLECPLDDGDALYFVNDTSGARALLRVQAGAVPVPGGGAPPAVAMPRPSAPAQVYEQEIGLLTPGVAEALAAALERYPEGWIGDALREAARQNARSWAYAEAILRRWEAEGRDDGEASDATTGGDPAAAARRDHGPYERVIHRSWE